MGDLRRRWRWIRYRSALRRSRSTITIATTSITVPMLPGTRVVVDGNRQIVGRGLSGGAGAWTMLVTPERRWRR